MDEEEWLAELAQRTPSPDPDEAFFADFEPRGLLEGDEPAPVEVTANPQPAPNAPRGEIPRLKEMQGVPRINEDGGAPMFGSRDFFDHGDDVFMNDNVKLDELLGQAYEDAGLQDPLREAATTNSTAPAPVGAGVNSGPLERHQIAQRPLEPDTRNDAALAAALAHEINESQRDLGNALAQLGSNSMGGNGSASVSSIPPVLDEPERTGCNSLSSYTFQFGRRDERGIPKYLPVVSSVAFTFDGSEVKIPRRRRVKGWKARKAFYDLEASAGKLDERTGSIQLTDRPVYRMMHEIKQRKAKEARQAETERKGEGRTALQGVQPTDLIKPSKSPRAQRAEAQTRSRLWVDKHRPYTFAQLLGEERIHRTVLGWIKAWDPCVFKTSPPPVQVNPNAPWEKPDPLHRPQEKVLLLSGPAGAGKTTLAHVLAQQAGYDVYEMNASDARAASSVEETLRQALDAGSSVKGKKPTLVVLDEIDGATGGFGDGASFIRSLVRLIERGSLPPRSDKKNKKAGRYHMVLQRPIICICNDLYAPSLRTLRPIAKVIRVPVPPSKTVVQRLRQVSAAEGLPTDNKGLTLLTELTGGDLRSCLNALQLLAVQHGQQPCDQEKSNGVRAQRARRGITEESLRGAALGIKDGGSNLPRVWDVLLRVRNSRQLRELSAAALTAPESADRGKSDTWLTGVVHELQLCGEYDKVSSSLAAAWPSFLATAKDDGWGRAAQALDWLSYSETLSLSMRGGNFEMLPYIPYAIAPWHGLFAHHRIPLPDYPKQDMEARQRSAAFQEVVQAVQESLPAHFRATFDATRVATELGPMLTKIINPFIRPINSQVTSQPERVAAQHAVEVMLSLGIRFVSDKNEAGHTIYRTEPPLDEFGEGLEDDLLLFAGLADPAQAEAIPRETGTKGASGGNSFAVRHYLAREVGKALYIRAEQAKAATLAANGKARGPGAQLTKEYLNRGQAGIEAPSGRAAPVTKDFFGRPLQARPAPSSTCTADSVQADTSASGVRGPDPDSLEEPAAKRFRPHPKVTFRFNEGFSNAVRKCIRLQDLL